MRATRWRFIFLIFCSSTLVGYDFCYDNPAPLVKELESAPNCNLEGPKVSHGMGMDALEFNLLYTVYSLPNVVLPLFGGYLIDRIGKKTGILLFTGLICAGQAMFALSTHIVCWAAKTETGKWAMIASRVLYGLGGENLSITTSAFIGQWFKGKELAFALGVDISAARIAATVNDFSQPQLYKMSGNRLHLGYWIGFGLTVFSIGCAVIAVVLDTSADKSEAAATISDGSQAKDDSEDVHLSDMFKLSLPYWLITGCCVFFYMSYFSLLNVLSDLMQERFAISGTNAGFLMGIPYFMAALASPITGMMVDRIGKRPLVMLLSNVFTIIGFVILIMMPQNDDKKNIQYMIVLPLALVGFAYCFYVSGLWPSIPYVVDKKFLGSAYGITTAIQNCGLAVGPLIAGAVTNTTEKGKHYRLLNFIQIAESAVGLVLAIWLWIYDSTHGGVLSSDSETAAKRQEEQKIKNNSLLNSNTESKAE